MAHQDELRAALTAGRIPTNDDKVALLADRLRLLGHLYRARRGERNATDGLADHLSVIGENGGGKVCHGSGGIVPQLAE
jgi:hypothetical protein